MRHRYFWAILALFCSFLLLYSCENKGSIGVSRNPYPEEVKTKISRGTVCFSQDQNRIFLSWRLLPTDPRPPKYSLWRKDMTETMAEAELVATTNRTNFVDSALKEGHTYAYSVRVNDEHRPESFQGQATAKVNKKGVNALSFDIGHDYKLARVVTGDLTGDGEIEVVIGYSKMENVDPYKKAWKKSTDSIKVAAFRHSGERLWTIDLGPGIESGGVYAPIVVWDIDADGRAEIILKTNPSKDPLDYRQERITVLYGETGKIVQEANWPLVEGRFADDYNNNSRNFIAIAHLDGKSPAIIVGRGLYNTQVIWAYDNKFNRLWKRSIGKDLYNPINNKWLVKIKLRRIWNLLFRDKTRGSHSLPIADINNDGKEEILWGEHCIGEDGKDLWVVKDRMPYLGQPDIVFAADIRPDIKGKEIFYVREGWYNKKNDRIGMLLVNSQGQTIWSQWGYTHVDGGWVTSVVPETDKPQCFAYDVHDKKWTPGHADLIGASQYLWSADGKLVSNPPASWIRSFPVDWEGDGIREIFNEEGILERYNGQIVEKFGPGGLWAADLYGDQREEIVFAPQDGKIYILVNTDPLESPPHITRLADRQYKNDLSRTAMQFNVVPTESGFIPLRHKENSD
jgi:rhamnogalacturonan endolyase